MPIPTSFATRSGLLLLAAALTAAAARGAHSALGVHPAGGAALHTRYGAAVALGTARPARMW